MKKGYATAAANATTNMRAGGDDTDTLAAMAGALRGALGGLTAVPFVDKLEDGERGRSHIRELADKLASRAA